MSPGRGQSDRRDRRPRRHALPPHRCGVHRRSGRGDRARARCGRHPHRGRRRRRADRSERSGRRLGVAPRLHPRHGRHPSRTTRRATTTRSRHESARCSTRVASSPSARAASTTTTTTRRTTRSVASLARHLTLAARYDVPVVLHCRDAERDLREVIEAERKLPHRRRRPLLHGQLRRRALVPRRRARDLVHRNPHVQESRRAARRGAPATARSFDGRDRLALPRAGSVPRQAQRAGPRGARGGGARGASRQRCDRGRPHRPARPRRESFFLRERSARPLRGHRPCAAQALQRP